METVLKHAYIKMNIFNATEIYIWRDNRGYVQTDVWVLQETGWMLYGVSSTSGYLYFKKLIDS